MNGLRLKTKHSFERVTKAIQVALKMFETKSYKGQALYAVRLLTLIITVGLLTVWLEYAVIANLNAADGGYILHVDERITYDGVERIQNASNPFEFIDGLSGPDQRYGRTTWYLAYIATLVGEPLGGESGKIISTRIFFAATLLLGIAIVCWAVTGSMIAACIAFACALFTPYASYYATMPKPEPLMVLFLGLFMAFAFKWQKPTGGSFVFLGLAYGTKISAIPAIALLGGYTLVRSAFMRGEVSYDEIMRSAAAFLLGTIIAVPVILINFPRGIRSHLGHTWGARAHGSDSSEIGPLDWLGFIESHAFFGDFLSSSAIVLLLLLLGISPFLTLASQKTGANFLQWAKAALVGREAEVAVVTAIGIAFLAAIAVSVQRLWGFYLFPGALFLTIAAVAGAEMLVVSHRTNVRTKLAASITILIAVSAILISGFTFTTNHFEKMALRSESRHFLDQRFRYLAAKYFSEYLAKRLGTQIEVSMSGRLWLPSSSRDVNYTHSFGPYRDWSKQPDVVFLSPIDITPEAFKKRNTPMDAHREKSSNMLDAHSEFDGPCSETLCYAYIHLPNDGMHFFIKKEWEAIATGWVKSDFYRRDLNRKPE